MNEAERKNIVPQLETFLEELRKYYKSRSEMESRQLSEIEIKYVINLRRTLVQKVGKYRRLIVEITEIKEVPIIIDGQTYPTDIWTVGLLANPVKRTHTALGFCIDITGQAIGKLKDDIEKGIRHEETGQIITPTSKPPKAFIAHGGDSPALSKLKKILEALGVQPIVVEEQPSEGRSVAENVDWYAKQADCAIILATKGDVDGKTGGFIPRGNVLVEIGKLQELLKERIIYLLQAGTKFPTNVSEKVWERFTSQSMDNAFIKIAKELTKYGILKAAKPQL